MGTGFGPAGVDDEIAEVALDLFDAVNMLDQTGAWATQKDRPDSILPFPWITEATIDDNSPPPAIRTDVVGEAEHRSDAGASGSECRVGESQESAVRIEKAFHVCE